MDYGDTGLRTRMRPVMERDGLLWRFPMSKSVEAAGLCGNTEGDQDLSGGSRNDVDLKN